MPMMQYEAKVCIYRIQKTNTTKQDCPMHQYIKYPTPGEKNDILSER